MKVTRILLWIPIGIFLVGVSGILLLVISGSEAFALVSGVAGFSGAILTSAMMIGAYFVVLRSLKSFRKIKEL